MICSSYYCNKQHVNISPLIRMTGWLMAIYCSQKTTFDFLSVFNDTTSIYQHETIFVGYFWMEIWLRHLKDISCRLGGHYADVTLERYSIMISHCWELDDWILIIFFPGVKQTWNNICVNSLKDCTEKTKTSKLNNEITYFYQLSVFL